MCDEIQVEYVSLVTSREGGPGTPAQEREQTVLLNKPRSIQKGHFLTTLEYRQMKIEKSHLIAVSNKKNQHFI